MKRQRSREGRRVRVPQHLPDFAPEALVHGALPHEVSNVTLRCTTSPALLSGVMPRFRAKL
eukprot:30661-Alexandrium_andersonii.AAC.1